MYFIEDIPVRREVRQRFVEEYEEAARDVTLLRLAKDNHFSPPSKLTDRVILPYERLAANEGKLLAAKHKKYCGQEYLDRYLKHFPDASFNDSNFRAGLAREVVSSGLPAYVTPGNPKHEDCVFFVSGRDATASAIQRQRRRIKAEIIEAASETYGVTQMLVNLFAGHRETLYYQPMENIQHAYEVARSLQQVTKRDRATAALGRIELQPVPLLFAPPLSARAYDTSLSYQQLSKEVLNALFLNYYELDLKSAQLATVAALWDIGIIQEFLADDQCIWTELARAYDQPLTAPLKKALKKTLYATIFGAGLKLTNGFLTDAELEPERFNQHYIIKALHEARARHIRGIQQNEYLQIGNRRFRTREHRSSTLLALQAQFEEQMLLQPIFNLATDAKGRRQSWSILVYKFDGLIGRPREGVDPHTSIKNAQRQVAQAAAKRGIRTRLEVVQILA